MIAAFAAALRGGRMLLALPLFLAIQGVLVLGSREVWEGSPSDAMASLTSAVWACGPIIAAVAAVSVVTVRRLPVLEAIAATPRRRSSRTLLEVLALILPAVVPGVLVLAWLSTQVSGTWSFAPRTMILIVCAVTVTVSIGVACGRWCASPIVAPIVAVVVCAVLMALPKSLRAFALVRQLVHQEMGLLALLARVGLTLVILVSVVAIAPPRELAALD